MPPIFIKTCPSCLSVFNTSIETKKFCTKKCRIKNRNARKHPYKQKRREVTRQKNTVEKVCVICDKAFSTHLKKDWCSSGCATINRKKPCSICLKKHHPNCKPSPKPKPPKKIRVKKPAPTPRPVLTIKCATCSKTLITKNNRQKFCSKKCCNAFLRPKAKTKVKTCRECGEDFKTKYQQKKFCSARCRSISEKKKNKKERFCQICSKPTGRGVKFCIEHKNYHQNKKPEPKTTYCTKCSSDITGTGSKKYCRTCSLKLFTDKSPHYRKFANRIMRKWKEQDKKCVWCKSPEITIDHITPLTKRGELMDVSNLQPMCRLCNISKGNKIYPYIECERYFLYVIKKGVNP